MFQGVVAFSEAAPSFPAPLSLLDFFTFFLGRGFNPLANAFADACGQDWKAQKT
jgi:hypothetical protein